MNFSFVLFSIFVLFSNGFDLSNEPKKNPDDSVNFGILYDCEEINRTRVENALKKIEVLKNNNLNIFFNKYFEQIDVLTKGYLTQNTQYVVFGYPHMGGLYQTSIQNIRIQQEEYDKHMQFFNSLSSDLSVLYKNESMLLYNSMNEDFAKKLIKLNVTPPAIGRSGFESGGITLFETLIVFESKNLDFKELVNKKFKNAKNIMFEHYYVLIIF